MDSPDFLNYANWQAIEACATISATFLAGLAFWQTSKIFKQQLSQNANIHEEQTKLAQRQLFLPLFEYIKDIRAINPKNIDWDNVSELANFLDLIAICYQGQLVDIKILRRSFGPLFIETFEQLQKCVDTEKKDPTIKDGPTLLKQNPSIGILYDLLKKT